MGDNYCTDLKCWITFFSASLKTTDSWRPPPRPCIPSRHPKITSEEKVKCESMAESVLRGSKKRGTLTGGGIETHLAVAKCEPSAPTV